jgi:hypothetical protein
MAAEEETLRAYYPHYFELPKQYLTVFQVLQKHSGKSHEDFLTDFLELGIYAEEVIYEGRTKIPQRFTEITKYLTVPALAHINEGDYLVNEFEPIKLSEQTESNPTYTDIGIRVVFAQKNRR